MNYLVLLLFCVMLIYLLVLSAKFSAAIENGLGVRPSLDRAPSPACGSWFPSSLGSCARPASSVRRRRPDCFLRFGLWGNLDTSPIWPFSGPWSDFLDSGGKCIGKIEIIKYRLCFGALLGYGYRKGDPHPSGSEAPGLSLSTIHKFFWKNFLRNFSRKFSENF